MVPIIIVAAISTRAIPESSRKFARNGIWVLAARGGCTKGSGFSGPFGICLLDIYTPADKLDVDLTPQRLEKLHRTYKKPVKNGDCAV